MDDISIKYLKNREKIGQKLREINTTLDREQAYEKTIDYILAVARTCWEEATKSYGWENEDIESEIQRDYLLHGLLPYKTHVVFKPDQEDGKDETPIN